MANTVKQINMKGNIIDNNYAIFKSQLKCKLKSGSRSVTVTT